MHNKQWGSSEVNPDFPACGNSLYVLQKIFPGILRTKEDHYKQPICISQEKNKIIKNNRLKGTC